MEKEKGKFRRFLEGIFRIRGILISLPVAAAAVYLAVYNSKRLPESVGLFIRTDGTFAVELTKNAALWVPLGITGICILVTAISKKVLYPWLISIFSLVIPIVFLLSGRI